MNQSKGKARPQTSKRPQRAPRANTRKEVSVKAPVATSKVVTTRREKMEYLPNGDCIITHREYLTDIPGSIAFASTQLSINPGLPANCPWLSAIAQRFESYRFESLSYLYETEQATTATGTVMLVVDYDASDAAPTSKTQALSFRNSVRSAPWAPCRFTSDREDLNKRQSYYVRAGSNPAATDIKLYDVGNLFVCTIGQANTNVIGELYIEYRVRLMTPQMSDALLGESLSGIYTGTSNAAPFGTSSGNVPMSLVSTGTTSSSTTLTFSQPFEGNISILLNGTGLAASAALAGTAQSTFWLSVINAAATQLAQGYYVRAELGETLVFTSPNTTITSSTLVIGQVDIPLA